MAVLVRANLQGNYRQKLSRGPLAFDISVVTDNGLALTELVFISAANRGLAVYLNGTDVAQWIGELTVAGTIGPDLIRQLRALGGPEVYTARPDH